MGTDATRLYRLAFEQPNAAELVPFCGSVVFDGQVVCDAAAANSCRPSTDVGFVLNVGRVGRLPGRGITPSAPGSIPTVAKRV